MKYIIFIFVLLTGLLCEGSDLSAPNQPLQSIQNNSQDTNQQYQAIENWYTFWVGQIRRSAEERAARLTFSEREIWTEFIMMTNQTPSFDTYFFNTARSFLDDKKTFQLRTALMDRFFIDSAASFLMDPAAKSRLSYIANNNINITDAKERNFLLRMEAKKILAVMDEFIPKLIRLANQREAKLADLQQWEKDVKANVTKVTLRVESQPQLPQYGVVSAISYGPKDILCMVEGVDEIIKPGDTINNAAIKNVKVGKIGRYKVEFEKDGQRWAQAVGQTAQPMWKIND